MAMPAKVASESFDISDWQGRSSWMSCPIRHRTFVVGKRHDYEYCAWSRAEASKKSEIKSAIGLQETGSMGCVVHAAQ
jgi:hypothetical protein